MFKPTLNIEDFIKSVKSQLNEFDGVEEPEVHSVEDNPNRDQILNQDTEIQSKDSDQKVEARMQRKISRLEKLGNFEQKIAIVKK